MVLKTFKVDGISPIKAETLTPESFLKYGGVISADHQLEKYKVQKQTTDRYKIHKVAPIVNNYSNCPSGKEATQIGTFLDAKLQSI